MALLAYVPQWVRFSRNTEDWDEPSVEDPEELEHDKRMIEYEAQPIPEFR